MKMLISTLILLAPVLSGATTTVEYYRSAFCDAQTSSFLIDRYTAPFSLKEDKLCHQTPPGTIAIKVNDFLASGCTIIVYGDYGCTDRIGSILSSGKCAAVTNAHIGSWQAVCDSPTSPTFMSAQATSAEHPSHTPSDLKRRVRVRSPASLRIEMDDGITIVAEIQHYDTNDTTVTAFSLASAMSSAISGSASIDAATVALTSSPSAGAALSSAIISGTAIENTVDLTAYVTASRSLSGSNATYKIPSMSMTTATYTGKTIGNGTATMRLGGVGDGTWADGENSMRKAVLGGLAAVFVGMVVL